VFTEGEGELGLDREYIEALNDENREIDNRLGLRKRVDLF